MTSRAGHTRIVDFVEGRVWSEGDPGFEEKLAESERRTAAQVMTAAGSAPPQRQPEDAEAKGDGETWEAYARRLEQRIKGQRDHIRAISALRNVPGDIKARRRIALLERSLGRMTARWYREVENRENLVKQLEARP